MSITINELEKQDIGPVWVVNTTTGAQRSIIVLNVPRPHGGKDVVKVFSTWLAQNLSDFSPRRDLVLSNDFRTAVRMGVLKPITEEEAEAINKMEGSREERARVAAEGQAFNMTPDTPVATTVESPKVSARAQQLVEVIKAPDTTAIQVLNTLRNMGKLSMEDADAILRSAQQKRGFDSVALLCESMIRDAAN